MTETTEKTYEDVARTAFIWTTLCTAFATFLLPTFAFILHGEARIGMVAGWIGSLFYACLAFWAWRAGAVKWPCRIMLCVGLALTTIAASVNGGVEGNLAVLYVIAPLAASFFLGMHSAVFFGLASCVSLIGLYLADEAGLVAMSPFAAEDLKFASLVILVIAVSLIMVFSWAFASRLRRHAAELDAQRREAVAANDAKTIFLAMMSHEIRTPLNGIVGMAQVLARQELNPNQSKLVDVINEQGGALSVILNDILDYSKIATNELTIEQTPFSVREVCQSAIALYQPVAAQNQTRLTLAIADEIAPQYCGDPTRLRQILNNLVSNAIKFTPGGLVTVSVSTETIDGRAMVTTAVTDTGAGIRAEYLPRIFDSFSQEDTSTTRQYGGTGLGLTICKKLCEAMDGFIEVASTEGEGSTFRFGIPMPLAAEAADETPQPAPRQAAS